jgi:hypothetical protein
VHDVLNRFFVALIFYGMVLIALDLIALDLIALFFKGECFHLVLLMFL